MNEGDGFTTVVSKGRRRRAKKNVIKEAQEATDGPSSYNAGPNGIPHTTEESQPATTEATGNNAALLSPAANESTGAAQPSHPSVNGYAAANGDSSEAGPSPGPDGAAAPNSSAAYCSNGTLEDQGSPEARTSSKDGRGRGRASPEAAVDDGGWNTVVNKKKRNKKRRGEGGQTAVMNGPEVQESEAPSATSTDKNSDKKAKTAVSKEEVQNGTNGNKPQPKEGSSRSRRRKKAKGGAKKQEEGDLVQKMVSIIKTQDPKGQKLTLVDLANFLQEETKLSWNKNYKKSYGPLSAFLLRQDKFFVVLDEVAWLKEAAPKPVSPKQPVNTEAKRDQPRPSQGQPAPAAEKGNKKSGRRKKNTSKNRKASAPNSPISTRERAGGGPPGDSLGKKFKPGLTSETTFAVLAFFTFVALIVGVLVIRNIPAHEVPGYISERIRSWFGGSNAG